MYEKHLWYHAVKLDAGSEEQLHQFLVTLVNKPGVTITVGEVHMLSAMSPTPDNPMIGEMGTYGVSALVIQQDTYTVLLDVYITPPNVAPCPACKTKGFVFDVGDPETLIDGMAEMLTVDIGICGACEGSGWIWAWVTQMPGQAELQNN